MVPLSRTLRSDCPAWEAATELYRPCPPVLSWYKYSASNLASRFASATGNASFFRGSYWILSGLGIFFPIQLRMAKIGSQPSTLESHRTLMPAWHVRRTQAGPAIACGSGRF